MCDEVCLPVTSQPEAPTAVSNNPQVVNLAAALASAWKSQKKLTGSLCNMGFVSAVNFRKIKPF